MLQDKFQFTAYGGDTLYTAVKQGDFYRVSWEVEVGFDEGSAPYNIGQVERYVEGGEWTVVNNSKQAESNINYFAEIGGTQGVISSGTGGWVLQDDGAFSVNLDCKGAIAGIGLGVARPVLESRKIGKNRIELVDKGFPNALWEIARLMTKAQEVKQYKDHDWKKLPIETFSSAASRHRMKTNMGEIYDDEFAADGFEIRHKVNEAFNVLAELELLLEQDKVK